MEAMSKIRDKKLLRPDEVATILNISNRSVYRLVSAGHFEVCRIGGSLRVIESSVRDYIKRQIRLYQVENGVF